MKDMKRVHSTNKSVVPDLKSSEPVYSMIHDEQVDILAQALLREYMHKKNFKETMLVFDQENPRDGRTVSSRAVMGDLMCIPKETQEKYKKDHGASTIMEMLCYGRIEKRRLAGGSSSSSSNKIDKTDTAYINTNAQASVRECAVINTMDKEKNELLAKIEDVRNRRINILNSLEQLKKDNEEFLNCSISSTISTDEEKDLNTVDYYEDMSFLPSLPEPLPPVSLSSSQLVEPSLHDNNSGESDDDNKNKKEKKMKRNDKKVKAYKNACDEEDDTTKGHDKSDDNEKDKKARKKKKKKYLTIDDLLEQEVPVVSSNSGTYDEIKNKKKKKNTLDSNEIIMQEGDVGLALQMSAEEAALAKSKKKILIMSVNDAEKENGVEVSESSFHNKSMNPEKKKKNVQFSNKSEIILMNNTPEKKRDKKLTSSYGAGFSSTTAITPTHFDTRASKTEVAPTTVDRQIGGKVTTSNNNSYLHIGNPRGNGEHREEDNTGTDSSCSKGGSSDNEVDCQMRPESGLEEDNVGDYIESIKDREEAILRERRFIREGKCSGSVRNLQSLISKKGLKGTGDGENISNSNRHSGHDGNAGTDVDNGHQPVVNRSNGWMASGVIGDGNQTHSSDLLHTNVSHGTHKSLLAKSHTVVPLTPNIAVNGAPKPHCIGKDLANCILIRLVGGDRKIPSSFMRQGFYFNKMPEELRMGLVQNEGGPCGVLAVVQAFLISYFIKNHFIITPDVQRTFLVNALVDCLCNCQPDLSRVVVVSPHPQALPSGVCSAKGQTMESQRDYIANQMIMTTGFSSINALKECLGSYLPLAAFVTSSSSTNAPPDSPEMWTVENGYGVISLIISCLLSRDLREVAGTDMDVESPVIVEHGYCSQELVNLLLTGRATSNVHDGVIERGSMQLKGLFPPQRTPTTAPIITPCDYHSRLAVGFLSHFECKGVLEVGKLGKYPDNPIWIIDNESHYTVAFMKKDIRNIFQSSDNNNKTSNTPQLFDIYYYDQHGAQSEEIRITLTVDEMPLPSTKKGVPYLNNILRTIPEWRSAKVNWNGTDPLL